MKRAQLVLNPVFAEYMLDMVKVSNSPPIFTLMIRISSGRSDFD